MFKLFYFFFFLFFVVYCQKKDNFLYFDDYIGKYYFQKKSSSYLKWQKNNIKRKVIFSLTLPYSKTNIFNCFIGVTKEIKNNKKISSIAMIFQNNVSLQKGIFLSFGKKTKNKIKISKTRYKLFLRKVKQNRIFFAPQGITKTIRFIKNQKQDKEPVKLNLFKKINENNIMVVYFYIESLYQFKPLVTILDSFNLQYQSL